VLSEYGEPCPDSAAHVDDRLRLYKAHDERHDASRRVDGLGRPLLKRLRIRRSLDSAEPYSCDAASIEPTTRAMSDHA
jgi:hypothetical protein